MSKVNDSFKDEVLLKHGNVSVWKSIITNPELIKNLLSDIPFLHYIFDGNSIIKSFNQARFIKKCAIFFEEMHGISFEDCNSFLDELERTNQQEAADTILSLLDRYDNIHKVDIMINLFKAKIRGDIMMSDFLRLSMLLERIPYIDLIYLNQFEFDNYILGATEILLSAGVISETVIDQGEFNKDGQIINGGNKYRLNSLGIMLCRFGLNLDIRGSFVNGTDIAALNWKERESM